MENVSANPDIFSIFKKKDIDTSYVTSFNDKLIVGILIPQKFVSLSVMDMVSNKSLEYEPNIKTSIGIEGAYKWLALGLAYSFPLSNSSHNQYGNTKSIDFQYNLNLRRWIIDGYFQIYKGFYFSNMSDFFDLWSYENDYPKRDLTVGNFGIVTNYILNHGKFSYQSSFSFNEKQNKSAGSFVFGGFALYNALESDTVFIPDFAMQYFQDISQIKNLGAINVGITFGYTYTFILRNNFSINMGLIPGYGVNSNSARYNNGTPIDDRVKSALFLQTRMSFLYQKNNFYACFSGIFGTQTSLSKSRYSFSFGHGQTKLSIGYRFDAPEFLVNKVKHLSNIKIL